MSWTVSCCRAAWAAAALAVLAGCPTHEPKPKPETSSQAAAPDTHVLGAGPVAANCGIRQLQDEILREVNAARAAGHRCGARAMPPASPLKWDAELYAAAAGHSLDMARRNYFEHRSPEGGTVSERATAQHYAWKSVGENIAGGDRSVGEVVQGWLASPDHCENIMDPNFRDMAVACAAQAGSEWGTYWTMVLGRKG